MKNVESSRRRFFVRTLATAGALVLAGCERLSKSHWFPQILAVGEKRRWPGPHRVTGGKAMAREFTPADLSPSFRSNGTAEPDSDTYRTLMAGGFADYRLEIGGVRERPRAFLLRRFLARAW